MFFTDSVSTVINACLYKCSHIAAGKPRAGALLGKKTPEQISYYPLFWVLSPAAQLLPESGWQKFLASICR